MPRLRREGTELWYEVHGSGPALLLTHGFSATSAMWRGQVEALSRDHAVVVWDMRGHGQSDAPDDPSLYSEAATVADMAAILDAAGADRAVVGGLSLGGYMSLAFLLAHPERVRGLLAIATGPGFRSEEPRAAWNARAIAKAERLERDGLAALQAGARDGSETGHRSAAGLARAARGMLVQRDARVLESLPHVAVPALVVVGANDRPLLDAAEYMARKIPGARKVVVPDAGHAVNLDRPEAFNAALAAFLAEIGRA